jgi:transcriptional regulator with XRE-family HTH domain
VDPSHARRRFREALHHIRTSQGLTIRQLAERMGCAHSSVAAWEEGRRLPASDLLGRLSAELGMGPDDAAQLRHLWTAARKTPTQQ